MAALQSGNVHLAVLNDPLVAKTAEGRHPQVAKTPQLSYHVLQLNARKWRRSTDLDVRLAIQCAIDRQAGARHRRPRRGRGHRPDHVTGLQVRPERRVPARTVTWQGRRATSPRPGKSAGDDQDHRLAGRVRHLGQRGPEPPGPARRGGHQPRAEVTRVGAYVDRWVAADFDAAVALNGGRPDPDGMYGRYFTSTGNLNKVAGYTSPELDALFAQGKSTSDPAARKPIYAQISEHLEDNAVWVWLFTSYTYTATTPSVQGSSRWPTARSSTCARRRYRSAVSHLVASAPSSSSGVRGPSDGAPHRPSTGGVGLTLLGVAVLVFVMLRALPGNQITASWAPRPAALSPAQLAALRAVLRDGPAARRAVLLLAGQPAHGQPRLLRAQPAVGPRDDAVRAARSRLELAVLSIVSALADRHAAGACCPRPSRTRVRDGVGQVVGLAGPLDPRFLLGLAPARRLRVAVPLQPQRAGVRAFFTDDPG